MILKILFYFFALVLIYAAFRVITARNPIIAALHLVLTFVTASALWMLIQAEFLALILVIVYVGAVMVLFLFVVMMLDIPHDTVKEGFTKYLPAGFFVSIIMVVEMGLVLANKNGLFGVLYPNSATVETMNKVSANYSNTAELGQLLYTQYLYPFEIVAVILLLAMIAAISLTHRKVNPNNKTISVTKQLKATKSQGMKLVKMPSSKLEDISSAVENTEKGAV